MSPGYFAPGTSANATIRLRKLLSANAQQRTGNPPNALDWADLDAKLITAFLKHLETRRHNNTRTRNLRLTAIRSLFTYAALRHPEHAALIQQVLAIPAKRFGKQLISFLTETEINAPDSPISPSFPPAPDGASAPTPSSTWSTSTPPSPPPTVRRSGQASCTRTSCGTVAP